MSEPQMPLMAQMAQIPQIKMKRCLINVISVISVISGSDGFFPFLMFFASSLPHFLVNLRAFVAEHAAVYLFWMNRYLKATETVILINQTK